VIDLKIKFSISQSYFATTLINRWKNEMLGAARASTHPMLALGFL